MAKYNITHSCGHTQEHNLFGKHSGFGGRDSKKEWLAGKPCTDCWKKEKAEEAAKEPITAIISLTVDTTVGGDSIVEVFLLGGTAPRKEEIKALGYTWGEQRGNVLAMLSFNRPNQGWVKYYALTQGGEFEAKLTQDLTALSAVIKNNIGPLDIALAQKRQKEKTKIEDQLAQIQKPARPACHPKEKHPGKFWNGKYYGAKTKSYYIDNVPYYLTDAEYEACMQYREAIDKYNKEVEVIKKGG